MENNIYDLVFKVTHAGGSGSCFYLKSYDLFVTNYHVVAGYPSTLHCWPWNMISLICPTCRLQVTTRLPLAAKYVLQGIHTECHLL